MEMKKKEPATAQDSLGSSTTDGTVTERQKDLNRTAQFLQFHKWPFIDRYSQRKLNRSVKKRIGAVQSEILKNLRINRNEIVIFFLGFSLHNFFSL